MHYEPSAPPLPQPSQVRHAYCLCSWLLALCAEHAVALQSAPHDAEDRVCDICMEANIEVYTSCKPVKHAMCIECARAVCSMKVRDGLGCAACRQLHSLLTGPVCRIVLHSVHSVSKQSFQWSLYWWAAESSESSVCVCMASTRASCDFSPDFWLAQHDFRGHFRAPCC